MAKDERDKFRLHHAFCMPHYLLQIANNAGILTFSCLWMRHYPPLRIFVSGENYVRKEGDAAKKTAQIGAQVGKREFLKGSLDHV